ncbi:Aldo/keto reductase [Artomyces pyxidatus]|uniref:Aldo/keto reductase n=1 Tax=Artomyces pyxidatus TaxID=48021 RepID=A0ACB8SN48_9AGAM|nr:Aldo/keto reductase [Artomyces pyxidatus]
MVIPTFTLNDGNQIPALAFGSRTELCGKVTTLTFVVQPFHFLIIVEDATEAIVCAFHAGFSHVDTAALYGNEESVGRAVRESGFDRADLYVTTKYDGGDIPTAIRGSLDRLGIKSVDLYLIHTPRSVGVSNFSVAQLRTIVETGEPKPAVNQIFRNPYNHASHKALLAYSAEQRIVRLTTAPCGPVDPVLAQLARRIGGTPGQVLFKWVLAKGAAVVTTTSKSARIGEYLASVELPDLLPEEVVAIDGAGAQKTWASET